MKEHRKKFNIGRLFTYIVLLLGAYIMLVPFVWMVLTSFKTFSESMRVPITWLPDSLYLENYKTILNLNISRYYANTIFVTVAITAAQILIGSMAAYAFARVKFPGRNFLFGLTLCMLMVPSQMTLIPKYAMCLRFGLVNNLGGIIVPNMFSVTATFFIRQSFLTLPKELEDAARLDGCSHFRFFWQVAMPLSKSILAAMAILVALYAWNDLLWPIIVTGSDKTRTLAVFIAALKGEHNNKTPLLLAGGTLSVLPMILVFIFGQKHFIAAIASTGIKE